MRRIIFAATLALVLMVTPATASAATIAAKCSALVTELNPYRAPDVRLRDYLCSIAHNRALQQARGRVDTHNLPYVKRKLAEYGIRWCSVGEVVAWTDWPPSASRFIKMWRSSSLHWSILTASRYDSAGGSWRAGIVRPSRTYAVMVMVDLCG